MKPHEKRAATLRQWDRERLSRTLAAIGHSLAESERHTATSLLILAASILIPGAARELAELMGAWAKGAARRFPPEDPKGPQRKS
jgi:hypothetical protein